MQFLWLWLWRWRLNIKTRCMINETEFYNTVMQFDLDDPEAAHNFTQRLAKENNWPIAYTLRAVFEYKRFMFLICQTKQMLSPSNTVDQVWHLHLLYTKSYWEDFCGTVLKRAIHHIPSQGGKQENAKHKTMYKNTLDIYRQVFSQSPPEDIWPSANAGELPAEYRWIDRKQFFIIPRPNWWSKK